MLREIIDLYNYINHEDAELLYTRLKEKHLNFFYVFKSPAQLLKSLGCGVYLFVNCFTEIKYIGYSKDMQARIRRHNKYVQNDIIITIHTHSTFQGESLETELLGIFRDKCTLRNKITKLKGKRR